MKLQEEVRGGKEGDEEDFGQKDQVHPRIGAIQLLEPHEKLGEDVGWIPSLPGVCSRKKLCRFEDVNLHKMKVVDEVYP